MGIRSLVLRGSYFRKYYMNWISDDHCWTTGWVDNTCCAVKLAMARCYSSWQVLARRGELVASCASALWSQLASASRDSPRTCKIDIFDQNPQIQMT